MSMFFLLFEQEPAFWIGFQEPNFSISFNHWFILQKDDRWPWRRLCHGWRRNLVCTEFIGNGKRLLKKQCSTQKKRSKKLVDLHPVQKHQSEAPFLQMLSNTKNNSSFRGKICYFVRTMKRSSSTSSILLHFNTSQKVNHNSLLTMNATNASEDDIREVLRTYRGTVINCK